MFDVIRAPLLVVLSKYLHNNQG